MKSRLLMLMAFGVFTLTLKAQEPVVDYPKIGEKIKDHTFTDVVNYPEKSLKISDYKGKWLVIDFWSRGCSGCIASFPKINKLNHQLKDKVKIMMVGLYDNRHEKNGTYTKNIFHDRAKQYQLDFTNAFDSVALDKYDIWGLPAIFVINPEGIIVAKTVEIDSLFLENVIAGKPQSYRHSYSAHEARPKAYNDQLPLLTNGQKSNGGIDTAFIGRSILSKWQTGMPEFYLSGFDTENRTGTIQAIGFDLPELYRIAFTGMPNWNVSDSLYRKLGTKIFVEVKDTALFRVSDHKKRSSSDTYAYQRTFRNKSANIKELLNYLRNDLDQFLGYHSSIQTREVDVLNLVVINHIKVAQLRSKGGKKNISYYSDKPGIIMSNLPFTEFIEVSRITKSLRFITNPFDEIPVIIDSTGIDFNIDMNFDGDPFDWPQVLNVLNKHGLDLIKGKVKMESIIISDCVQAKTK